MLLEDYQRVSEVLTREALKEALTAYAEQRDFPIITAALVIDHAGTSVFHTVACIPEAAKAMFESNDEAHRDPVMQHLKTRSTPLVWDQRTYADANAGDLWEEQAPLGFRTGIALALHLPQGRHFVLGMDRDKALPTSGPRLTRVVADLQLLAVHLQDAALRLLTPPTDGPLPASQAAAVPGITARERDILRLLVQGRSNKGIAHTLQVSDNTIEFHLKNVFRKLECSNRTTAIVKTLQYGLV